MAGQALESSSSDDLCFEISDEENDPEDVLTSSSSDGDENDPDDAEILRWLDQALQKERQVTQHALEQRHSRLLKRLGPKLSRWQSNSSSTAVAEGKVQGTAGQNQAQQGSEAQQIAAKHSQAQPNTARHSQAKRRVDNLGKLEPIPEEPLVSPEKDASRCVKWCFYFSARNRRALLLGSKTWYARFANWVNGPVFELACCGVIIMSAVVMAFEMQYRGLDSGRATHYPGYSFHAVELWPWASKFFLIAEWVLGISFTVELLLKMVVQRRKFVRDMWNLVDCLICAAWLVETILQADVGINPMLLRLVRLLRLYRLLRVFKTIAVLDSLYLMMTALRHCYSLILASSLVLILIHMCLAILLQSLLEEYIRDPTNKNTLEVYKFFGSFSRTMLTMLEMTLGTWMPACRVLVENVSEWYSIFFLMHKFLIGFSVVTIITAVFIHEAFQVAGSDETIMLKNLERSIQLHEKKMIEVFKHADEDGVGALGRAEFTKVVGDPVVTRWLASIGLKKEDAGLVFDLLAHFTGKQKVTASELVKGAVRLKGSARQIDVLALTTYYRQSHKLIQQLTEQLMYPEEEENSPTLPPKDHIPCRLAF